RRELGQVDTAPQRVVWWEPVGPRSADQANPGGSRTCGEGTGEGEGHGIPALVLLTGEARAGPEQTLVMECCLPLGLEHGVLAGLGVGDRVVLEDVAEGDPVPRRLTLR